MFTRSFTSLAMNFSVFVCLFPVAILFLCSHSRAYIVQSSENVANKLQPVRKMQNIGPPETKLKLTVFYESLCGGCEDFFKNQFSHNWLPFYDYLNIYLIPYGKANQTRDAEGNWSFKCQHGEEECYYNRIQVCAMARLLKDRPKKLFSFISCFESLDDKESAGPQCANLIQYPYSKLETCAKSKEGFNLLAAFGYITHHFKPKLQWVPTIVLNNKFNQTETDLAMSDLRSLLCEKLGHKPTVCV